MNQMVKERKLIKDLQLIVYDFDGVLTDNRIIVHENGLEAVIVNRSDGLAITEIIKLGIMKSHQGKNYGSYLIQKIKSLPIKKIFIEVSCLNKIAINFYIKNGFKKIGIRKNYYILKNNSRTDALRLSCEP